MERIPINAGTVDWSGENPGMYLKDSFVAHFGAFKGVSALACCRFEKGSNFVAAGDARATYTERFSSQRGEIRLTWEPLGDVFMVEMPKDKSARGREWS